MDCCLGFLATFGDFWEGGPRLREGLTRYLHSSFCTVPDLGELISSFCALLSSFFVGMPVTLSAAASKAMISGFLEAMPPSSLVSPSQEQLYLRVA